MCEVYDNIKKIVVENGKAHLTLVTKIMLGVFGNIPAFDEYFGKSFRAIFKGECGFRCVNPKSLECIREFYDDNREKIDALSSKTFIISFSTGKETSLVYPKAKIIDMYGFAKDCLKEWINKK